MKKNILVCVTGLTPQVVTEALFCLSKQREKISVDEVYVLTTSKGRDVIAGKKVTVGKGRSLQLPALSLEIDRMCNKYKFKRPKFDSTGEHVKVATELSIELNDIRDDHHNKLFPNTVCRFLNELSKDNDNIVHCLISGGRKSMSVDLAFGLSLFGRENDRLWHVLTHVDQEFQHFFPEKKSQEKDLMLSEIPYVRLRRILANGIGNINFSEFNFTEIVNFTQQELLKKVAEKLYISTRRREIWYGNNERVEIGPKPINLYRYLADNNLNYKRPITLKNLAHNFSYDLRTKEKIKGYDESNIRILITNINKLLPTILKDPELIETFKIHSGSYGTGEVYLNVTKENLEFLDD